MTNLPSFIIIGAIKAATTWTHDQLQSNPALYLPDPEPHFFSDRYERGLAYYSSLFSEAVPGQIIGEKSANYFTHPLAPSRIAETLPDIPLVLQLRNPIDRAYSDYKMLYRRGTVLGQPESYLIPPGGKEPRFLEFGRYAKHLSRWLDYFDASKIQIILYEDLKSNPEQTMHAVCKHIGAPSHYDRSIGSSHVNDSSRAFLPLMLRSSLAPWKRAVKPLRGNATFEGVRKVFAKEISYPPLTAGTRRALMDFYGPDIEILEKMIGRSLSHWLDRRDVAA